MRARGVRGTRLMDIKGDCVDGYPELKPDSMAREGLDVMSEHVSDDLAVAEEQEKVAAEIQATADQAFAAKLSRRSPPNEVERAEIEKAKKRTKARPPRLAMHLEKRGAKAGRTYPSHSDEEGHRFRLADAFGTRSLEFVNAMLKGVGMATEDHTASMDFGPGSPDQLAFNAALAVIDGVRPKDEVEAMLAGHMAVCNVVLLELVARTRGAIAGHLYQGSGLKRLDVLGNLTAKFMRTYTLQVEALARKRRKGEQTVTVKHVHVHAGGQAVVGNVTHRSGRGVTKNEQRPCADERQKPEIGKITNRPSVWGAHQERDALPVTPDEQGPLSSARRRKR